MAIKSIKDKIANIANSEILGETDKERVEDDKVEKKVKEPRQRRERIERSPKPKPKQARKPRKPKVKPDPKPKEIKEPKASKLFNRRAKEEPEVIEPVEDVVVEVESEDDNPIEGEVEGYEDVLSILGIKKTIDLEVDFQSDDLDYVEFSQTTPLGFDFDEVTDFISRTKYTLDKLETALKQRNNDLIVVASEVKKVEQKMVERSQEKELERMIGGMTEEERLIEENMNLRIEVNELKGKLINNNGEGDTSKLLKEIEALEAENNMLKMSGFSVPEDEEPKTTERNKPQPVSLPSDFDELPTIDSPSNQPVMPTLNNDSDSLDSMIQDMGGMYDEEE